MPSGLYQTHTDVDTCPQCGVAVGKNALMCQECGHVLTGQERWAQVEPKKRLVDRVPPLVLGTIIALPIGVLMFFLFKDVILPMSEGAGEKRAQPVRKETGGKPAMQVARDLATVGSSGVIKNEVQRLMAEEIISNHTPDYAYFTAGSRWAELSEEARRKELENLRKSLRASRIPAFFKFVMPDGEPYASVGESRIEINVELEKRLAYPDGMAPFRPIEIPPELGGGPSAPHAEPEVGEETQSPPARKLPRGM
jgi:hypothetical protein